MAWANVHDSDEEAPSPVELSRDTRQALCRHDGFRDAQAQEKNDIQQAVKADVCPQRIRPIRGGCGRKNGALVGCGRRSGALVGCG